MFNLENCMYYTFSTISQTLATGLGLLAAVVLFRLDKLDRNFHELVTDTVNFWHDSKGQDLKAREAWDELLLHLKNVPHKENEILKGQISRIKKMKHDIPNIKKQLLQSIQVTSGTIFISVSLIVLTPVLHIHLVAVLLLLILGVVLTIANLFKYYQLIHSIL